MSTAEDYDDKDWEPISKQMRPDLAALLEDDPAREFDPEETLAFLERIAEGYGPTEVGLSMGWSQAQIARFVNEPSRKQILDMLQEAEYESAERAILTLMKAGNSTCVKLYAISKMSHRGWADRREVAMTGQSQHEIVISVREALDSHMREVVQIGGTDAIAALQSSMLDTDIVDAELVE